MTERFYIKQLDLRPALQVKLLDGTSPVDLLNATEVLFLMRNRRAGLKASGPMAILDQSIPDQLGLVTYSWQPEDTDAPGEYNAEFQVTWPAGKTQTFPAHGYVTIVVEKDLGP